MSHIVRNESETAALAAAMAAEIKGPKILFLRGDLGVGKTVFCRSMIRELAKESALEVPSPTFTLVQYYDCDIAPIYHFDLYRLENPDDVFEIGWEEATHDGIVLVEWPGRLGPHMPRHFVDIRFAAIENDPDSRKIEVTQHGN